MKRRTFLTTLAAGTTAAAAGCIGNSDDAGPGGTGNGSGNGTGDASENGSDDTTTRPSVTLANTDFSVVSQDCGQGTDDSDVTYQASAVAVEGVISASDTCYTARMKDATYDPDADTLTVAVETYVPEENEGKACAQCLVDIEYAATVNFEGGLPATVVVTHGGKQVASAEQ